MSNIANRPGHISYHRGGTDSYTGCAFKWFLSPEAVNEFFEAHPGYLVVDLRLTTSGNVAVLYTSILTEEEMADLREWSLQQENFLAERKAAREESKLQADDAAVKAEAEKARLAELGRKCELNHAKNFDARKKGKK